MKTLAIIIFGLAVIRSLMTVVKSFEKDKIKKEKFWSYVGSFSFIVIQIWAYVWFINYLLNN